MNIIFIRSPFFIEVDETSQIGSKVELFIWNKGTTEPTQPTYTLSKKAPSVSQSKNNYNISNYVKEYINIIEPTFIDSITVEDNNQWCYVKVKRYKETTAGNYTLLDETVYVAFNGYTNYLNGKQIESNGTFFTLSNFENKKYKYYLTPGSSLTPYVNFFVEQGTRRFYLKYTKLDGTSPEIINIVTNPAADFLYKIPITKPSNTDFANGNAFEIWEDLAPPTADRLRFRTLFIPECEIKYTPMVCSYINRTGGWESIAFFKARTENWEVKNKEYNLLPDSLDYNTARGESKFFNYEAKKSIKINTGWVEEHYNELIKDLMTSETILLDGVPVKLKTMSTDLKTSLQDKMINYTIDFEYNFNQINNVI